MVNGQSPASTEGTRRVTVVDADTNDSVSPPDPEVSSKQTRRYFSKSYKLRILDQLDRCNGKGEKSALLRREGLYSQAVARWRKQRKEGKLTASPQAVSFQEPADAKYKKRLMELELENERLHKKLDQAQKIIDIQKKMSELLQIPLDGQDGND